MIEKLRAVFTEGLSVSADATTMLCSDGKAWWWEATINATGKVIYSVPFPDRDDAINDYYTEEQPSEQSSAHAKTNDPRRRAVVS